MSERRNRWDIRAENCPPPTATRATDAASSPAPEATPAPERLSRWGSVRVVVPTPTPDGLRTPSGQQLPCLFFGSASIPLDERVSILDTVGRLPQESIVAQFARGSSTLLPSPAGATKTEATVYKTWHQEKSARIPNRHFTVQLQWVDERRNLVPGGKFGNAHVHQNELETIVRFDTGQMLVRRPGEPTFTEHRADTWKYIPRPSGRPPPWTQETGLVTDADVGEEGYARAGVEAPAGSSATSHTPSHLPSAPQNLPPSHRAPSAVGPATPARRRCADDMGWETTNLEDFY